MRLIDRLTTMITEMIRDFQSGEFSKIVAYYDFPLALHLEDRLVLLARPADLERYLAAFHIAAKSAAFVSITPQITAVELPRRGRFRAWVHYTHLDASGRAVGQSDRTFFCRDLGDRILVEMLELTQLPVSSLRNWTPEHRMIA